MATRRNPYITFDGTAREAMEVYRDVFGGELSLMTFGQMGDQDAPGADKIMRGMLESCDRRGGGAQITLDIESP